MSIENRDEVAMILGHKVIGAFRKRAAASERQREFLKKFQAMRAEYPDLHIDPVAIEMLGPSNIVPVSYAFCDEAFQLAAKWHDEDTQP